MCSRSDVPDVITLRGLGKFDNRHALDDHKANKKPELLLNTTQFQAGPGCPAKYVCRRHG